MQKENWPKLNKLWPSVTPREQHNMPVDFDPLDSSSQGPSAPKRSRRSYAPILRGHAFKLGCAQGGWLPFWVIWPIAIVRNGLGVMGGG